MENIGLFPVERPLGGSLDERTRHEVELASDVLEKTGHAGLAAPLVYLPPEEYPSDYPATALFDPGEGTIFFTQAVGSDDLTSLLIRAVAHRQWSYSPELQEERVYAYGTRLLDELAKQYRAFRGTVGQARPSVPPKKLRTLQSIRENLGERMARRMVREWANDPELTTEALADEGVFLETLDEALKSSCSIEVRDDGLVEFWTLYRDRSCDVARAIGGLPVVLFHHTATGALPGIIERGGLVSALDLGYEATKRDSGSGVYLTSSLSGDEIKGYVERARRRFGGDHAVLEIVTTLDEIEPDPDDTDLSCGRHQFLMPFVPLSSILGGLDGEKNPARARRFRGYKAVARRGDKLFSLYDGCVVPAAGTHYDLRGFYLGTSRQFVVDYYTGMVDEDEYDGETILTFVYTENDLLRGDPAYPNGEVLVRKAHVVGREDMTEDTQNPLDPRAYSRGFSGGGVRPVRGRELNEGVHVTTRDEIATIYAVGRAAGEGPIDDFADEGRFPEPNCGIVIAFDASGLVLAPEGDAMLLNKQMGVEVLRGILETDSDIEEAIIDEDEAELQNLIYSAVDSLRDLGIYEDDYDPSSWWQVAWRDASGQDANSLLSWLQDLDEGMLLQVMRRAVAAGSFSDEDWAAAISQWRIMEPIGPDRVIGIYAVHPVELEIPDDEWNSNPDQLDLEGIEEPQGEPYVGDEYTPWPSLHTLYEVPAPPGAVVVYHGTDVARARLALPLLAWSIYCPWPFGQPES